MTDCIKKEGRGGRSGEGRPGRPRSWRSLGGGALTGPEGRLLLWRRTAHAVASGAGVKGLTHLPRRNLKLLRTLKRPDARFISGFSQRCQVA